MLLCDNIGIIYNDREVFKDFSLSLDEKSIILLRGKNGSGKTSLLKILATIIKPSFGKIKWNDQEIDLNQFRQDINYIGHTPSIKLSLSVIENIKFWADIYKNPELILASIYYFGLANYIDIKCEKLSAGIRQRIELTRLILKDSKIWLLDEPDNNLDEESKILLNNLIISKADQGGIIIIASHNKLDIPNVKEINLNYHKINYQI